LYNPLPPGKSANSGAPRGMPQWQPLQPLRPIELQNAGFVQQTYLSNKSSKFALWTVEEQQAANNIAEAALADEAGVTDVNAKGEHDPAEANAHHNDSQSLSGLDVEALEKIKQEAYERGLVDGQQMQQATQQAQTEQDQSESLTALADKANQILANIEQGVVALQEKPAAYNEPLKRLALHLAEQLTLCELSLASTSIQTLIDRCIETLDVQSAASVVVELNPTDLALLQNHKAVPGEQTNSWRMVADTHLLPGSVRVRADDAVVSDLIEHRLETLAQALLETPKAWQAQTAFHPERLSARRGKAETVEDALPRDASARFRQEEPEPLNLSALDLPDLDLPGDKPAQDSASEDVSHD
jgi:flagellar biosynthesis/type III secretory pathway protein FliH